MYQRKGKKKIVETNIKKKKESFGPNKEISRVTGPKCMCTLGQESKTWTLDA